LGTTNPLTIGIATEISEVIRHIINLDKMISLETEQSLFVC